MERAPLEIVSILGAMYVLTVTVWAICLPSIQERPTVRRKLSALYWIVSISIPAWRLLEGLAIGRHLREREPSNFFQDVQAAMILVFIVFAFLLHAILNELSKK